MPLWVNAERNRITNFFNKLTKPTSSRPTSSRSAPPKVSSPKHSTSKPASPGPPSTEPIRCSHEEHSLQDTATEGGVFALRRSYHSLAPQSRARAIDARVKNLVKLIEKIRDGQYEGEQLLIKRKLTYSEYGRMLQFIENSEDEALRAYFNDKLRFDYTRAKKEFVIRMPSFLHDTLAEGIGLDIGFWLENRVNYSDERTVAAAKGIIPAGTSIIDFPVAPGFPDKKGPDKSFQHQQCEFPGLVIEVAWSQRKLDLPWLADQYIQRSKGEIRTVVGVNLNDIYREKRRKGAKTASADAPATFSIWRAEFDNSNGQTRVSVKNSVRDQDFRNHDGNPVPSVGLQLSLKDFVCENVVGSFGEVENPQLVISSESLCKRYEAAMALYLKNEARKESNAQIISQQKPKSVISRLGLRRSARLQNGLEPVEDRLEAVEGELEGGPRRSARLRDKTGQVSMTGANPGV